METSSLGCKKSSYEKEAKLRRKYVLNLLNEPKHLAKIKTPKLHKNYNKGVKNLRERKLKNNKINTPRKQNWKHAKSVHVSSPKSRLEFFDVIG